MKNEKEWNYNLKKNKIKQRKTKTDRCYRMK